MDDGNDQRGDGYHEQERRDDQLLERDHVVVLDGIGGDDDAAQAGQERDQGGECEVRDFHLDLLYISRLRPADGAGSAGVEKGDC